jgi:hypothetical protein
MPNIDPTRGPGAVVLTVPDGTTAAGDGNAGTALPDPVTALALSGDPGAELAALAVQSGELQENVARTARDTEVELEVHEDNEQVDALHKKADDIRASGIWEGVGMIAEGASGVLPAVVPVSSRVADAVKLGGKGADGMAVIASTFGKAAEANDDAAAAAARSASDRAKGAADDLSDAKKSAGDLISAALDFYREYTSAQAAANTAALHRA